MVSKYKYKNTVWIDLESPTRAEIADVAEEFGLPEALAEDLGTCALRSKADFYDREQLLYLVLHFPIISDKKEHIEQEVDFIVGKNFLITTRYERIEPVDDFSRIFGRDPSLKSGKAGEHAGYLFVHLLRELYRHSLESLENINDSLKKIETDIYANRQAEVVSAISDTNRKFLNFKQAFRHHGDIITSATDYAGRLFDERFRHALDAAGSDYNRIMTALDAGRELLSDMRDTNDSLLTTQTNQTIKTLTTMTFMLLPVALITGIFGMNTDDSVLFIHDVQDFVLVLVFMLIIGLIMFVYFKGKKWL